MATRRTTKNLGSASKSSESFDHPCIPVIPEIRQSRVTILHNVANIGSITVYLDGVLIAQDFNYGDEVKGMIAVGAHQLLIRSISMPPVELYSGQIVIPNSASALVSINGIALIGGITIAPIVYDTAVDGCADSCPPQGYASVRFINGAFNGPAVNITFSPSESEWEVLSYDDKCACTKVLRNVAYGDPISAPLILKAGIYDIVVTRAVPFGTQPDLVPLVQLYRVMLPSGLIKTLIFSGYAGLAPYVLLGAQAADLPYIGQCDTYVEPWVASAYLGRWNLIAGIPQHFDEMCANATADYGLLDNGNLSVFNQCIDKCGEVISSITGEAAVIDPMIPAFVVSFPIPGQLPPAGVNYIVHAAGRNKCGSGRYLWAVVGSGDRSNLFILAREKQMDRELLAKLLRFAAKLGYCVEKVREHYDTVC